MLVDGEEQCVLGIGAGIEGSGRNVCALAESRDGECLVATLLEESHAGVEDALPLFAGASLSGRSDGQVARSRLSIIRPDGSHHFSFIDRP